MKKHFILLLTLTACLAAGAQELTISTAVPDRDVMVIYTPYYCNCVNRILPMLCDEPDDWSYDIASDTAQSREWQRKYGRLNTWRIGVDATTFLRDAAFSLPYTRGYTATGFFLSPYAKRLIGPDAQLTLGVNLAGAAGSGGFHSWQPLVRLEYEPANNVRLVMGTLYGGLTHKLYEPMFDRERYIYAHNEEGVQMLAKAWLGGLPFTSDTWLHWEELLEPWQMTQERFTLGSSNVMEVWNSDRAVLSVPFSFLGTHRGGQFTALDTCIQSLFNESVGLRFDCAISESTAIAADLPAFFYQDISPTKCQAYDNGWGLWPQIGFDHRFRHHSGGLRGCWHLLAQAGYWHGHQFIAPRGSYLFQSVSWHRPDFAEPDRDMLTAKLELQNAYNQYFSLGLDAEFYYDLAHRGLDFAFGLYMRYSL